MTVFDAVATDLVSRQVVHCHRVLRSVQSVAEKSTVIGSKTWDAVLRFLLAVNDVLLAPPTEKGLHCLAFCRIMIIHLVHLSSTLTTYGIEIDWAFIFVSLRK